jgi:hypothetical protein
VQVFKLTLKFHRRSEAVPPKLGFLIERSNSANARVSSAPVEGGDSFGISFAIGFAASSTTKVMFARGHGRPIHSPLNPLCKSKTRCLTAWQTRALPRSFIHAFIVLKRKFQHFQVVPGGAAIIKYEP